MDHASVGDLLDAALADLRSLGIEDVPLSDPEVELAVRTAGSRVAELGFEGEEARVPPEFAEGVHGGEVVPTRAGGESGFDPLNGGVAATRVLERNAATDEQSERRHACRARLAKGLRGRPGIAGALLRGPFFEPGVAFGGRRILRGSESKG